MTAQKSSKALVRGRMDKTGRALRGRPRGAAGRAETDDGGATRARDVGRCDPQQEGVEPLAWNAQAVAGSYELARGLRGVGEKPDGFAITASRTVAVPVERLYDAFVDESLRERWLPDGRLGERTATKPRSARFDWGGGATRVDVTFTARGEAKSTVALEHARLAVGEEAERMKGLLRERLTALKSQIEGGGIDA